ncbi:unnamed protein product, partial [Mesorhabditis belari]|uniref:Zinc-hook domain-containing protein n=1 Tax=Mesorhabditis belari TaxID=2138241 RepID=A0AAF3ESF7_9BILA
MAQLDSLLVQGIRSIGPDGSDAHVIKFQNPLTIIAGPNGSGKTTLIEALNFITTDTKPSGQYPAFIHNLEVCGRARVDALVKLKFFAANGKQVTATKRLNLSRAPRTNKITGKQDESTLVIVDQHGQKISLSSKVADTKTEMINLLDVPRAILTNVIFCHQENSTWPLGEPKQVKEKFDAIFELSKYVKILEKLRKMAKDQTQSLNVIHAELNHMQSNYDDRLKKEANREELQDRLLKLKQDLAKYNEKKQEVMHILKEASGKVEVYQGFSNERTLATSKLEMQLEQLKHFDVPDYSGSEEELLEAIQQITDSFEFKNIESRRIAVEKQMAELEASISMLEKQKRSLEAERLDVHTNTKMKEDYVDQIANLQKMIRKEYEFQATDIISAMEAFIEEEGARLEQYRAHQQKERQNLETRKNDLMEKRQKAKHEIRSKKDQEKKLETDIGILNTKINAVSSGQNELQSLQKRIVAIEKERSDLGEVDLSALDKIKQKRDKAQDELTRLKDQCAAAEVFEEAERSLVRLKQEMREAAKKLDELTAKNTADLTLVFDTEDQSFPISASIKDKVVSVRKELDFANKEHNSIEVALELAKSAEQRYTQEQIQLENQIKELEKEIGELTDLTPPEKVSLRLAELRTQLRNNQKELNPLESKFELYETWIEETEAKNCCPLCDRRFASKMAKNELVEKLTNLRVSTPREIERLSEAVTALDDQEKSFAKAEENFQKLNLLTEKLRKLQVERKESESKVTETEKRLKKIKNELTLVQKSSEACNRILVDAAIMDSLDLQIQKAKNDISETEHSLSQRLKAGRGYLELKQERQELEEKISSLLGEGDKLQLEANKRNKLSEELTQLQSQRLVLGDNAANLAHFENQLKEKEEEVAELSSSISSLETLLPELCEEESVCALLYKYKQKIYCRYLLAYSPY